MNAWWMLHWAACERLLSEQEEPTPYPIGVISGTRTITPPAEKPVTKPPAVTKPLAVPPDTHNVQIILGNSEIKKRNGKAYRPGGPVHPKYQDVDVTNCYR
jgi:hypothetical protein